MVVSMLNKSLKYMLQDTMYRHRLIDYLRNDSAIIIFLCFDR